MSVRRYCTPEWALVVSGASVHCVLVMLAYGTQRQANESTHAVTLQMHVMTSCCLPILNCVSPVRTLTSLLDCIASPRLAARWSCTATPRGKVGRLCIPKQHCACEHRSYSNTCSSTLQLTQGIRYGQLQWRPCCADTATGLLAYG